MAGRYGYATYNNEIAQRNSPAASSPVPPAPPAGVQERHQIIRLASID